MESGRLREVAACFLKLGCTAFGGPAAHLSLMRSELVRRRQWVEEQEFLDLIGGASLLPGPTSTEVAIMLAKRRAGWPGLLVGGVAFIAPAMLLVLALSWAYVRYGSTGPGAHLLEGILPIIIAIVADAVIGLARQALSSWLKAGVAAAALAAYVLGANPLLVLVGGLVVSMAASEAATSRKGPALQVTLWAVFLEFLKLGAVVFGSGYVLFAYLRSDLVRSHHWLSLHELLATVAIGQLTPGPVFTTATSIGYVVAGVPGALVATLGIFLPSFVLVAIALPVIGRVRKTGARPGGARRPERRRPGPHHGRDGRDRAWRLLVNWWTATEAVVTFVVIVKFKVNSTWLILAGAAVGLATAIR